MNKGLIPCVAEQALPSLVVAALICFVIAAVAEWRHVDWHPTLEWLRQLFIVMRQPALIIPHLDQFFANVAPRMAGQRLFGQWVEIKRWGWKLFMFQAVLHLGCAYAIARVCLNG